MACIANNTELCGAGNRLAVYVDSTAPSLIPSTPCLGVLRDTNFDLVAVFVPPSPGALVSAPVPLGSIELASQPEQGTTLLVLGERPPNSSHIYAFSPEGFNNLVQLPFGSSLGAQSLQLVAGSNLFFQSPFAPDTNGFFCGSPNQLTRSTYIGPPILVANDIFGVSVGVWAFCDGSGLVFSPNSTSGNCSIVQLTMTQPV
jgi:hypothetical protein